MKKDDVFYRKIIEEYKKTQSVRQTAKNCGTSLVTAQRILITEGVWSSETSLAVGKLWCEGKEVPEIAEELCVTEKTVQAYLPYTRGMYGGECSKDAIRSKEYRQRIEEASKKMQENYRNLEFKHRERLRNMLTYENSEELWRAIRFDEEEFGRIRKTGTAWQRARAVSEEYVQLHLELVFDGEEIDEEQKKEILRLSKADQGISRDVIMHSWLNLRNLHFAIQSLFGWQDRHPHSFSLSDEMFNQLTAQRWGGFRDLCGSLLRYPKEKPAGFRYGIRYVPGVALKTNLRDLCSTDPFYCVDSDNWLYSQYLLQKTEKENLEITDSMMLHEVWQRAELKAEPNQINETRKLWEVLGMGKKTDKRTWKKELLMQSEALKSEMGFECATAVQDDGKIKAEDYPFIQATADTEPSEMDAAAYIDASIQLENWCAYAEELERIGQAGTDAISSYENLNGKNFEKELDEAKVQWGMWTERCLALYREIYPRMTPITDTLYYHYDEHWTVKIQIREVYTVTDRDALRKKMNLGKASKDTNNYFIDSHGDTVTTEMMEALEHAYICPMCTAVDGLSLVDDCPGVQGYYRFLKILNGKDIELSEKTRAWGRARGWTGRRTCPKNML